MAEGRVLDGVVIDASAPIQHCRSCGQLIWWGVTRAGKRNPFDVQVVDPGRVVRTTITHFSTCADARSWSRKP